MSPGTGCDLAMDEKEAGELLEELKKECPVFQINGSQVRQPHGVTWYMTPVLLFMKSYIKKLFVYFSSKFIKYHACLRFYQ